MLLEHAPAVLLGDDTTPNENYIFAAIGNGVQLKSIRLLDHVRGRIRQFHYRPNTQLGYLHWEKFFDRGHAHSRVMQHSRDKIGARYSPPLSRTTVRALSAFRALNRSERC